MTADNPRFLQFVKPAETGQQPESILTPWQEIEGKGAWRLQLDAPSVLPQQVALDFRSDSIAVDTAANGYGDCQVTLHWKADVQIEPDKKVWMCQIGADGHNTCVIAELKQPVEGNSDYYIASQWRLPHSSFSFPLLSPPLEEFEKGLHIEIKDAPLSGPFDVDSP